MTLVFGDQSEIYSLGELEFKSGRFHQAKKNVYVYYEKRFDHAGKFALEERVSLLQSGSAPILDGHWQERFQQHPYLDVEKYWDVVKITKKDGISERYMQQSMDQGGKPQKKKKCDFSDWDKQILDRMKSLPDYVKEVLGWK